MDNRNFIQESIIELQSAIKNAAVKLIRILDYASGKVYCEEHEKYDAEIFRSFLKADIQ